MNFKSPFASRWTGFFVSKMNSFCTETGQIYGCKMFYCAVNQINNYLAHSWFHLRKFPPFYNYDQKLLQSRLPEPYP